MPRKIKFTKIPVIKSDDEQNDNEQNDNEQNDDNGDVQFCDIPVIQRYKSSLGKDYSLKEDLRGKIIENLYLDRVLGAGSNAVLMRAIDIYDGKMYAAKILIPKKYSAANFKDEKAAFEVLSENPDCDPYVVCMYRASLYRGTDYKPINFSKKLTKAFRSNPILKKKKMIPVSGKYRYFQLELMDMDLFSFLENMEEAKEEGWATEYPEIALKIIYNIIQGVKVIHDAKLAHMDLKPENILIKFTDKANKCRFFLDPKAEDISAKLGDLGFVCSGAKSLQEKIQLCGPRMTPAYAPPELIRTWNLVYPYSLKLAKQGDIWALGIVIGVILFGWYRMSIINDIETFYNEKENNKDAEQDYLKSYKNFLDFGPIYNSDTPDFNTITELFYNILQYEPENRPTIAKIKRELPKLK